MSETVNLMYAVAYTITEHMGYSVEQCNSFVSNSPPAWDKRFSNKLLRMRGDLSCLEELKAGRLMCNVTKALLISRYDLNENSLAFAIESLKQHVVAIAGRLSRYRKQALRRKQNRIFRINQWLLYKQMLNNNSSSDSPISDSHEMMEFWKSIWSCQKTHNRSAQWLKTLKNEFTSSIVMQDDIVISANKVSQYCNRMSNWKAPGLDQLHGF